MPYLSKLEESRLSAWFSFRCHRESRLWTYSNMLCYPFHFFMRSCCLVFCRCYYYSAIFSFYSTFHHVYCYSRKGTLTEASYQLALLVLHAGYERIHGEEAELKQMKQWHSLEKVVIATAKKTIFHPSIHPSIYPFIYKQSWSQLTLGDSWGTPWTSHYFIKDLAYREQPFTLTLTPMGNLKSPNHPQVWQNLWALKVNPYRKVPAGRQVKKQYSTRGNVKNISPQLE